VLLSTPIKISSVVVRLRFAGR